MFNADNEQVDFTGYRADGQTDFVLDYLRTRDGDRPWFLFLSYIEPHHQNDHRHFEGPQCSKERFAGFSVPGDLVGAEGDWQEEFPDYLGCCAALDGAVGRLRDTLEQLGVADNTVFIYTSDHGSHFRTRNGEYKRSCHDGCLRIPMIAWGPGFGSGGTVDNLVSLIDVPPTLIRAAGAEVPASMRGRAMQGLLDGSATDWPAEVFAQISESQCGRCVRTKRWKYSVRAPEKGGGDRDSGTYVEDFLYDLEADPHERSNRVRDPSLADVRAALCATLKRRMVSAGEAEPVIEPAPGAEAG
jgi:uncharacterized sulfatase